MNMLPHYTTLFLSHGGGPMPLLGDADHQQMVTTLQQITKKIERPDAIVVFSAHWEEDDVVITASESPELIYDYYGFPEPAYELTYPCPGQPELAQQLHQAFTDANITSRLDPHRGLDHGVFVPLKIMYPEADIPCVQASLQKNLDASAHINIGKALQALSAQNLLFIGSGFSFHNMKAFFTPETTETKGLNQAFENWLIDTCSNKSYTDSQRQQKLSNWTEAPGARYCQPREEHLLPLHICYGLNQTPANDHFAVTILNKQSSMYLWQPDE